MIQNKSYKILGLALSILCLNITGSSLANENQRRIENKQNQFIDTSTQHTIAKPKSQWITEYGGWINYRFNNYRNSDNDRLSKDSLISSQSGDLRFWMKFTLKPPPGSLKNNPHIFYLRFKDKYITRTGSSPGEKYDLIGPKVDFAYTVLNFSPVWIEAGRKYFNIGRGIIYSNINDGVQINYRIPGFNIGLFASKTLPHESNIDSSVPGYDKDSERYFYGLGAGYTGFKDQSIYSFILSQKDFSNERPSSPHQDFTYNSLYTGIGAKGTFLQSWEYWAELIHESGRSYVYTTNDESRILAWASDIEIAYAPDVRLKPRTSLEYAFGSGDKDRTSVTDTQFGNFNKTDKNFLYFGYAPTGFALAPRLSNLHMLRVGTQINPLQRYKSLQNLTVGIDYFRFLKFTPKGGISDSDATEPSRDIGQELDGYITWRVFSDLSFSLEYGYFFPGKAYSPTANSAEQFFSLSLTHTF